MTDDEEQGSILQPSGVFNPEFREGAVRAFGADGAWLLLSIAWYGWRVQYDLACALLTGSRPDAGEGVKPPHIGVEFDIVRDLQIQSAVFAASEQFATLVRAALRHVDGTSSFFDEYVGAPTTLATLIDDLDGLTATDVMEVVGDPHHLPRSFEPVSVLDDPEEIDTVDVEGILVPRASLQERAHQQMIERGLATVDLVVRNAEQLRLLIDAPEVAPDLPGARPLRDVDNAFRHAGRILFYPALPEPRGYRMIGESTEVTEHSVDLYLPSRRKGDARINVGTVDCSPDRTVEHMESLRQLSQRTVQVARGLLGLAIEGHAGLFVASTLMNLPAPPVATTEG